MIDIIFVIATLGFTIFIFFVIGQYYLTKQRIKNNISDYAKFSYFGSDAYVNAAMQMIIMLMTIKIVITGNSTLLDYIFSILYFVVVVISIMGLFSPLIFLDEGIQYRNRFIYWNEILNCECEVIHTDKIEKLKIKYQKKGRIK
ncbi:hypothetical protein [Fusibacter bizertensis]